MKKVDPEVIPPPSPHPLQKLYADPKFKKEWTAWKEAVEEGRQLGRVEGFAAGLKEGERRLEILLRKLASRKMYSTTETLAQESYNEAWDDLKKWLSARSRKARKG